MTKSPRIYLHRAKERHHGGWWRMEGVWWVVLSPSSSGKFAWTNEVRSVGGVASPRVVGEPSIQRRELIELLVGSDSVVDDGAWSIIISSLAIIVEFALPTTSLGGGLNNMPSIHPSALPGRENCRPMSQKIVADNTTMMANEMKRHRLRGPWPKVNIMISLLSYDQYQYYGLFCHAIQQHNTKHGRRGAWPSYIILLVIVGVCWCCGGPGGRWRQKLVFIFMVEGVFWLWVVRSEAP